MDPKQYGPELWPHASQLKRRIARVIEEGHPSEVPKRSGRRRTSPRRPGAVSSTGRPGGG